MPNRPLNQIQFRAAGLLPHLEERAGPGTTISSIAKRDLGRYYWLIGEEIRAFPPGADPGKLTALSERLEREPWDPPRMLTYLLGVGYGAFGRAAIVDALERAALIEGDVDARLRKVGLIR